MADASEGHLPRVPVGSRAGVRAGSRVRLPSGGLAPAASHGNPACAGPTGAAVQQRCSRPRRAAAPRASKACALFRGVTDRP